MIEVVEITVLDSVVVVVLNRVVDVVSVLVTVTDSVTIAVSVKVTVSVTVSVFPHKGTTIKNKITVNNTTERYRNLAVFIEFHSSI